MAKPTDMTQCHVRKHLGPDLTVSSEGANSVAVAGDYIVTTAMGEEWRFSPEELQTAKATVEPRAPSKRRPPVPTPPVS